MKYATILLATSFWLLPSCASFPTATDLDRWKAQTDKALATAAQLADGAKSVADAATAKIAELEAKHAEIISSVEAIAGPLDKNGDGDVTLSEAKVAFAELSKTTGGLDLIQDPTVWGALLASVLGIGVAKRGGTKLLAKVHATGRELVDADGDGKPDA